MAMNVGGLLKTPSRGFLSIFKERAWVTGSSEGAIGENQLKKRELDPMSPYKPVFVTKEKEMAKKYAQRSAEATGTRPVILTLNFKQKPAVPDFGRHNFEAVHPKDGPVKIEKVEYLD